MLAAIVRLEHGEVCTHEPCVEVPAYLTYAEPVLAAFVVVALVWDRLSTRPVLRVAQFVLLLMVMDLSFFRPLVYGFYDPAGFWPGMLSRGARAVAGPGGNGRRGPHDIDTDRLWTDRKEKDDA